MPSTSVSLALDRFTTFGDLLKYLRRRAGLTQRELSIEVNYSDTQISRLEQNERMPDLATLTARFLPALHIEDQPEVAERLLELAATMRREDAPAAGLPPYKGLKYFDESDAELFFGREALTDLLLQRLNDQLASDMHFLAVIGASGSGKSSLLRAGLIPALRWRQPSSGWPVLIMTPTAHPLDALAAKLTQEIRQGLPPRKLIDELTRNPQILHECLGRMAGPVGAAHSILIADQFEELFTLCRSEAEQSAFVDALMSTASQPDGSAMIVIAMRADFYAHCAQFDTLRQAISQHQEYIGPMTDSELRQVIEEPARRGHWELEAGLVELLLHDVGADAGHTPEPGALPLLSHALLATWQRRRGRMLTMSGYTASGGVRGAIAETAEAVFYDLLEPEQREIARQIFLRLTELGGEASSADTRRRVSLSELVSKTDNQEMVHEVLLTLADARLIITDQDTAEVAHEALIREWPTLRGWLEEDREGLRLHRRLTEAAQEWQTLNHDPGILFRGARLAQAIEWAEAHSNDINSLEQVFLLTSQAFLEKESNDREAQRQRELVAAQRLAETERARAEEQKLSSQRLRQRAVFLTIALVVVGVLAATVLVFWQQTIQANRLATSRELAAASVSNLQIDPERSLLLALQALSNADTLEARNSVHRALPELHILRTIPAHRQTSGVAYSPDGSRLASVGVNGDMKIWDAANGDVLLSLSTNSNDFGWGIAYSPDGKLIAAVFSTQLVVWQADTGQIVHTLVGDLNGGTINHTSFSPDGTQLAVANMDGLPKIWDLATGIQVLSLNGHTQICDAIAYSPDGNLLATGDQGGTVKIWETASGQEIKSFGLGGVIHDLAFSPDGKRLATANEDGTLTVWDPATGRELLSLPRASGMYGVTFMPDGQRFVTAHQDGTAKVWETTSGRLLLTLAGHVSTVTDIVSSPDGALIASAGYDGTLRIWDAAPGREVLTLLAHSDQVWDISYSSDGQHLATVSLDGSARLWDASSGQLTLDLQPGSPLTSLAFSPESRHLAAGGIDGAVYVWDISTGQSRMEVMGHQAIVSGLAFSPDGERLVSASWDSTIKVWDLSSVSEIVTYSGHKMGFGAGVAFNPDGRYVFSGGADGFGRQWDATTGQEVQEFSADGREVYGLALSPDGRLLALGLQDGDVDVWDTLQAEKVLQLSGHAGLVFRLAFSQDGGQLASAGFDGFAKVWDVNKGQELFTLYGNTSNVFGVAFSPDGAHLATAGADGTVRIFALRMNDLIALAKDRLTRGLTDDECRQYLHLAQCPVEPQS